MDFRSSLFILSCLSSPTWVGAAHAAPNLVVNGDFESTSMTVASQIGLASTSNVLGATITTNLNTLAGWNNSASGPDYIFFSGNPSSLGQGGLVTLSTSGNGGTGGNATLNSPTGGNIVGADAGHGPGALTQSVSGLSVGTAYQLSFYWAAATAAGTTAATNAAWTVTFGGQTQSTAAATTAAGGFSPWRQATMLFTATAATQALSFLASAAPGGQPGFALLDSVSINAVPEPAGWAVLLAGGGMAALARRRRLCARPG